VGLNTSDLCSEAPHCAKSIPKMHEDLVAIVGLGRQFGILEPFLVNDL
jgi:hypothetical protein